MAKAKKDEVIEEGVLEQELETVEDDQIDRSDAPEESLSDQEISLEETEKETETVESEAPEVAAINTDTETAKEQDKKAKKPAKKKTAKPEVKKARAHSKKYESKLETFNVGKLYTPKEAIEHVKEASYTKFDATVSVAIRLEKNKKGDDSVRGTIKLPHGTGKKMNVVEATDETIEKIKKGWMDFDILVATPAEMPKLAQVAKILGPKGKMPNPKDGTVVEDIKAAIEDLSENIIRYRADVGHNLHMPIGRVSWSTEKLEENLSIILKSLIRFKKLSITLSATMGPGVKLELK
jgi:large subunit ribosomal protein L1